MSVIFLVGSLSLSVRLNGTVDWIIRTANIFGLDIASVSDAAPFIQYERTAVSALSRSTVFVGIGLFSILVLIGSIGFVITPATGSYGITVTAPAGGATLHVGALTSVIWPTTGTVHPQVSSYKVWYSVDGGLSWELAGASASSPFSWTVPSRLSPSCSVRVVALDASSNVLGVATLSTFAIAP